MRRILDAQCKNESYSGTESSPGTFRDRFYSFSQRGDRPGEAGDFMVLHSAELGEEDTLTADVNAIGQLNGEHRRSRLRCG